MSAFSSLLGKDPLIIYNYQIYLCNLIRCIFTWSKRNYRFGTRSESSSIINRPQIRWSTPWIFYWQSFASIATWQRPIQASFAVLTFWHPRRHLILLQVSYITFAHLQYWFLFREVLCHPTVRDVIDEHFVFWGGDIHNPEAFRVRNYIMSLQSIQTKCAMKQLNAFTEASTYPFFAICCAYQTTPQFHNLLAQRGINPQLARRMGLVIFERIEGATSREAFIQNINEALERNGPILAAARAEMCVFAVKIYKCNRLLMKMLSGRNASLREFCAKSKTAPFTRPWPLIVKRNKRSARTRSKEDLKRSEHCANKKSKHDKRNWE